MVIGVRSSSLGLRPDAHGSCYTKALPGPLLPFQVYERNQSNAKNDFSARRKADTLFHREATNKAASCMLMIVPPQSLLKFPRPILQC